MKSFALSALTIALAANHGLAVAQDVEENTNNTDNIERIEVVGHNRNYLKNTAKSAFGLDLSLLKTPASVSVISQDLLKDLQVNNVDDALRNVAGVIKFKTGNGGEEKFSIRGFDASQSIYKDGSRINNGLNASNIPSTETANIERIEVLKGPSALLYGQGEPGGIINYITKQPEVERSTELEFLAGSDAFYKVELDTTGAATQDEKLAYRLVLSYEDSESFRAEHFRERLLLNPTLSYSLNDWSSILVGLEYIDDQYTQDRGQVLDGDLVTGYFYSDRLNEELFFGVPGFNDQTTAESTRFYIQADTLIADYWRIEGSYSQTENDKELFDSNPGFITQTLGLIGQADTPFDNLVSIAPSKSNSTGETRQFTLKNFLEFSGPFGTDHQLLISYTWEEFETNSTSFTSPDTVFYNIATDVYAVNDPFTPVAKNDIQIQLNELGSSNPQDFEESGINILDYITINNEFSFLIGGRFSEYEDNLGDYEDDDFSFRTGLVYSPQENLSFYLSYSQGYTSSGGALDINDQVIDPETSESWEFGSKWSILQDQLLLTAVLYSVEQEDIAFLVNPDAPAADLRFGNIGATQSDGLELEAVGNITENWRVQAGYSYIDNEITEGGTTGSFGPIDFALNEGNRLPGIAEHNVNITSIYELELGNGVLGLGGSVFYQDDVFASGENSLVYDGWTQVDLLAYYKWDGWKAQINVSNLFDEDYRLAQAGATPDIFAAIRVGTSEPRAVLASIAYEF